LNPVKMPGLKPRSYSEKTCRDVGLDPPFRTLRKLGRDGLDYWTGLKR